MKRRTKKIIFFAVLLLFALVLIASLKYASGTNERKANGKTDTTVNLPFVSAD